MAKNYSLAEAVQIIVENEDAEQIQELGKRFPLLVSKITFVAALAGKEFGDLMQFMPETLTANKVNQSIRKALEGSDEEAEDFEDEGEDAEETQVKKSAKGGKVIPIKKKAAEVEDDEGEDVGGTDFDSWNNAKMYKYLGEIGKRKDCKEKMGGFSHDQMLKYLKKYCAGADAEEDVVEDEGEEQASYEGMKATDLYRLCKERKIKAEQKKPAKYYVALLKKADEEAAQAEDDAEDEDWDDEEVEEEVEEKKAPAPKTKGGSKPAAKSASKGKAKPAKKEEEEDEDWDI